MRKSTYWRAVRRRTNYLVSHHNWPRPEALTNTRTLFRVDPYWRRNYEKLVTQ